MKINPFDIEKVKKYYYNFKIQETNTMMSKHKPADVCEKKQTTEQSEKKSADRGKACFDRMVLYYRNKRSIKNITNLI